MMNIHGYKQKYKCMVGALKFELSKPKEKQNARKIYRLTEAKKDCMGRIRLQRLKKQKCQKKSS